MLNKRYKYPKTYHLPWSEEIKSDDKAMKNVDHFLDKQVIVTEKMDGENTTIYSDGSHARSKDSGYHPSRNWIKRLQGAIGFLIPEGYRICGENLYAEHSIEYNELQSYFMVFSVWKDETCLSWDDTKVFIENINKQISTYAPEFKLQLVPVLYEGIFDEEEIKKLYTKKSVCGGEQEGYVVRISESFEMKDFQKALSKFVRKGHVQTNEHWMQQEMKINTLKKEL